MGEILEGGGFPTTEGGRGGDYLTGKFHTLM